ncbi:DNA-binding protein [Streptococcus equi subsp. equi]|uniref:DNA-binding protein n=1 Tax=Streptococcus equi subsp. equi TaxID=148942 RepID=A0A380JNR1_9STRE|nr:DNA-binding protein [Streptococcus equi subsp. equi]
MNHFGKLFKKFRESRGLLLKDVAKAGISTSQLSRFENGEADLTISKFMSALDEINMPIDEFMYAVHDFHRDELVEKYAVNARDVIDVEDTILKNLISLGVIINE